MSSRKTRRPTKQSLRLRLVGLVADGRTAVIASVVIVIVLVLGAVLITRALAGRETRVTVEWSAHPERTSARNLTR